MKTRGSSLLATLLCAACGSQADGNAGPLDAATAADAVSSDAALTEAGGSTAELCANLPPLPWPFRLKSGPPASEDFTFDNQGYLVALSKNNVLRMAYDGAPELVAASVSISGTGLRVLAGGDIVVGDAVRGVVQRITPGGGRRNVGTNIRSPNGIQIGPGIEGHFGHEVEGRRTTAHPIGPRQAQVAQPGVAADDGRVGVTVVGVKRDRVFGRREEGDQAYGHARRAATWP